MINALFQNKTTQEIQYTIQSEINGVLVVPSLVQESYSKCFYRVRHMPCNAGTESQVESQVKTQVDTALYDATTQSWQSKRANTNLSL
jgi:deoxycytidylate deaminase